jgi:hypothetical protein
MPRTRQVKTVHDLDTLKIFNADAYVQLKTALEAGDTIEQVESSFSDPGPDYVDFKVNGESVCRINGY